MRFTERADAVIRQASESARELKHTHVGPEHILLGLLHENEGLAGKALERFGVTNEQVRAQILRVVGPTERATPGSLPFTPRAKHVLELAEQQARNFGLEDIGTEHILLGLTQDPGIAERILAAFDADAETIRNELLRVLPSGDDRPVVRGSVSASVVGSSTPVREVLARAAGQAAHDGRAEIDLGDLLLGLLRDERAATLLADLGIDETKLTEAIERRRAHDEPHDGSTER